MAVKEFFQKTSTIKKGETVGQPVYTSGARIRSIGIPVNQSGAAALSGSSLSFQGSYDGVHFFTVNDYRGNPLTVATQLRQEVLPVNGVLPFPVIIPIREPELFEGCLTVRPVSDRPEADNRNIEIFQDRGEL